MPIDEQCDFCLQTPGVKQARLAETTCLVCSQSLCGKCAQTCLLCTKDWCPDHQKLDADGYCPNCQGAKECPDCEHRMDDHDSTGCQVELGDAYRYGVEQAMGLCHCRRTYAYN